MRSLVVLTLDPYKPRTIPHPAESRSRWSDEGRVIGHTPNGWPHLSSANGNCLCLGRCCFGVDGCICRSCAGVGHEHDQPTRMRRKVK
jgi:hypothetical protein